jgi:serine/threonine-protein kinase
VKSLQAAAALAALALLSFAPALAQAGDATVAEALFHEGKSLMDAGDLEHACPKLRESYAQDPATGTLLALAICFERRGKLASAWTTYSQVASRAHLENRLDREQAARERVAALAPKLSRLSVQVPAEVAALVGLSVKRDGQPMSEALWGSALPTDPGEHVIEVSAEGKKSWQARVTLAPENDAQSVVVPPLEPAEARPPPGPGAPLIAPPPKESASSPPARTAHAAPWRPIAFAVGGAGIVAIGVGSLFGLKATSANADSKAHGHCDASGCDATGKQLRNDAFSDATVSTVLFVAGVTLVAGGVTLYLVGGKKKEAPAPSVALSPRASRDGAALWLHGGF